MLFRRLFIAAACCASVSVLGACSAAVHPRGQLLDAAALEQIKPGIHQEDVARLLGSPSIRALLTPNIWFYFSGESRRAVRFLPRQVVSQTVLAMRFENALLVSVDSLEPPPVGSSLMTTNLETPTRGKTISLLERMFGNIGRFTPGGVGN